MKYRAKHVNANIYIEEVYIDSQSGGGGGGSYNPLSVFSLSLSVFVRRISVINILPHISFSDGNSIWDRLFEIVNTSSKKYQ